MYRKMIGTFVVFGICVAVIVPLIILKNRIGDKAFKTIVKVLAIVLFALGVFRGFMNDSFIWVINGGSYSNLYYKNSDVLQSLLRWGLYLAYVVYPCAAFFKARVLKNIAIYFCLPVAIVSTICYGDFMEYFLTDSGRAIMFPEWSRHLEFSAELIVVIIVPLLLRFCMGHKFDVKNKFEWINFFTLLPGALIVCVPVTLPQSLFGFTNKFMIPFTLPNFLWVAVILGLFIGFYLGYRFKDRETRYMICIFLALLLFLHYNSIYLMDLTMSRLPFQLCNLGSYLVLIALLIKKQSFFDFILIANVPGAMIAFCVPDIAEGMLSYWNIHFYIEHTWVFIIPLLAVALRIFDRPGKKAYKHFFVGFSIYFLFCAIGGIIANCFMYIPYHPFLNKTNYFYLFDTTVLGVLPFLSFTRDFMVTWSGYTFYPMYMLAIYILFSVFCLVFYYIYRHLCIVGDDHFKLRGIKIDMNVERGRYKRRKIPKKLYDEEEV